MQRPILTKGESVPTDDVADTYIAPDGNWGSAFGVIEFAYASLTEDERALLDADPEDFYCYMTGAEPLEYYMKWVK